MLVQNSMPSHVGVALQVLLLHMWAVEGIDKVQNSMPYRAGVSLQVLLLHMWAGGGIEKFLFITACPTVLVCHCRYFCYTCGLVEELKPV